MRAAGTENHHDLGLFSIGPQAPLPEPGRVGLYHLAWQVETIQDLAEMRERARSAWARSSARATTASPSRSTPRTPTATSSRSCGWSPREQWGDMEHDAITKRLDLAAELAQHG